MGIAFNLYFFIGFLSFLLWAYYIFSYMSNKKSFSESLASRINHISLLPLYYIPYMGFVVFRLTCLILCFICGYGVLHMVIPSNQIGSFLEAENYSAQYIVEVSRNNTTFYKLPADITREYDTSSNKYYVDRAYWPNGGYLYFEDDAWLLPEKEYDLEAQNGELFSVTLTKDRISGSYKPDYSPIQLVLRICIIVGNAIGFVYFILAFIRSFNKQAIDKAYEYFK